MRVFKGNILTMDEAMPRADYMAVEGGCILEVGMGDGYKRLKCSEVVELDGKTLVPGFWESHLHVVDGIRTLLDLNLRQCDSVDGLRQAVLTHAKGLKDNDWIIGHGWELKRTFAGTFPDRFLLDSMSKDHPIVLINMDGHSLCANTLAIDILKLDQLGPSPEIPLGADGRPTGMFYENTEVYIAEKISSMLTDQQIEAMVLKAQEHFFRNGICSVNDICTRYARYFDIYRRLQNEGRLKLRITASPYGVDEASVKAFEDRADQCSSRLKIGLPKYFMDGSFGSRTALLSEDYADDAGNRGLGLFNADQLEEIFTANDQKGHGITIHAIGDQAVHEILNAYEKAACKTKRHSLRRSRIEHVQIIKDEDIGRFARNGIVASFQPVFLYEGELTKSRLGSERLNSVYRFKSMLDQGVTVLFNSDWPYGGGNFPKRPDGAQYIGFEPILGIHAASIHPIRPEEKVSSLAALKAYTTVPAEVNGREKELGRLRSGYLADFVVLDRDITNIDSDQIIKTEVLMTVVEGEIVYKK